MINNNFIQDKLTSLEKKLDYKFNNVNFILEALTHPSMKQVNSSRKDYERLELLGDSILGFLITEMIFNKFTHQSEGNLAKIKSYVVSSGKLVAIANTINLSSYLIMTQGEENAGGRNNPNNIENAMEAVIAAVYLDSNIESVKRVVENYWKKVIYNIDFCSIDPKTYLQEYLQRKKLNLPKYKLISQKGPVHEPLFTVKVSSDTLCKFGTGKSIKKAEKKAAQNLLKTLGV